MLKFVSSIAVKKWVIRAWIAIAACSLHILLHVFQLQFLVVRYPDAFGLSLWLMRLLWYHLELLVWRLEGLVLNDIVTLVIASFTTLEGTWWMLVTSIVNLLTIEILRNGLAVTWYILDLSHRWLFVREDLAIKTCLTIYHILHCQSLYILVLKRGQVILKGYLLRSSSLIQLWLL